MDYLVQMVLKFIKKLINGVKRMTSLLLSVFLGSSYLQENVSDYIYTSSADDTVRKIDTDGNEVWSFTGHTGDVIDVAVDFSGNVYSGGVDNTVREIRS